MNTFSQLYSWIRLNIPIPKIRVFTFQLNYIEKLRELCSRNSYTSEASVGTVAKSDSTEITNMSMSIWVSGQ